jgi:membrane protease YdiL (CAAX protease family)
VASLVRTTSIDNLLFWEVDEGCIPLHCITLQGLLLQALVFGAGHGYQGARLMLVITIYGCLFGWLAIWRRSLRPGMVADFFRTQ